MGFAPWITAAWLGAGYAGKRQLVDKPAAEAEHDSNKEKLARRNRLVQAEVSQRTAAYRRQTGEVTTAGQALAKQTPATQREVLG